MTDYYQLMRITPQASEADIILAYRQVRQTFSKDSLAVYSLYGEDELTAIRQQIDEAYAVLSSYEKRRAYDIRHGYASEEQVAAGR